MSGPFILPETQAILDLVVASGAPHLATLSAPDMRAVYRDMGAGFDAPAETGVRKVDFTHDGIGLRAYFPGPAQAGPVIVYFHGGGWVIGDLETHDPLCTLIASLTGLRALDYGGAMAATTSADGGANTMMTSSPDAGVTPAVDGGKPGPRNGAEVRP